jgi:hypothetical protein
MKDFQNCLLKARDRCEDDEWALMNAREEIVRTMTPGEAHDALAAALKLTEEQDSPFCFANCCWLILALARTADTTQLPTEALPIISALKSKANLLHEQHELEEVLKWFRI